MKSLEETVVGMLSNDWKERLVAEIEQCDIRLYNLEKHMDKIGEDSPEHSLLKSQSDAMGDYLKALTARATVFDVKYTLPSMEKRFQDAVNSVNTNDSMNSMFWMFLLFYLAAFGGDSK